MRHEYLSLNLDLVSVLPDRQSSLFGSTVFALYAYSDAINPKKFCPGQQHNRKNRKKGNLRKHNSRPNSNSQKLHNRLPNLNTLVLTRLQ